ncbi:slipin family protein [Streptomyces sp. NPDC020965]|uniref:slipin family protein n=1 Tax=Streptomyces sp. NPDC020965 TaxID=3365105 RepID=UPI0037B0D86A
MVETLVIVALVVASGFAAYAMAAARVVKQYERGVVFRLGRLHGGVRGPGFNMIVPVIDRIRKVNMQVVTMPVPAQEGITGDNVTVRVDAVVYFRVVEATDAIVEVEDYRFAVSQMAQTSLRSIIGKSDLDDLLSNREKLNEGLELMIDSPAMGWGVQIDRVEIKDVSLPEAMKRSMARQAEADRERRARVINADAELQASKKLAQAAGVMAKEPAALQLRLLQTVVAVAAEKNSTLVLPFPVELLRFLERAQQPSAVAREPEAESATSDPLPAEPDSLPATSDPLPAASDPFPDAIEAEDAVEAKEAAPIGRGADRSTAVGRSVTEAAARGRRPGGGKPGPDGAPTVPPSAVPTGRRGPRPPVRPLPPAA